MEKYLETEEMFAAFIDMEKADDKVRGDTWAPLRGYGVRSKLYLDS